MTEQNFTIQRQFIKDVSFELFMGSKIFSAPWQPKIEVELATDHQLIDPNQYEVDLTITVKVNMEDSPAFLIEVVQSGLFDIVGFDEETVQQTLNIMCPTFLFPYAREAIDSISTRAGMLPIGLQPVNFEDIYATSLAS